jgi:nucleoid-associated protein YgaU
VSKEEGLSLPNPDEITGEEGKIASAEDKNTPKEVAKEQTTTEGPFVLNDLSPNSISGESYTVNRGDTLWEIAEARYGSGFEWKKILEANKDAIGFLPNGSQALITPGQTLILPS